MVPTSSLLCLSTTTAHVIAALSEHYHLLPKAEPGGEDDDRAEWLDGEVMAARGKRVVRLYFEDPRNTPEDARELASALASAADVAEEPR
ncbi:hypothetical protein [Gordonia westfalica]|uniref:Uncharacterized protein n=1 Tax=Gordonia westfalica TaxID=158898 RepID=A0A1H2DNH4_9ACTN|nr:hypothetical protein [Gordonia westfalica]SDT83691.1 hypothetical protein SAMN04488548_10111 [Gordonia westfalica]SDT83696.1 hypothetical protein SAMN04488548_10116 [Gordonia westfalica]SDT84473.1 hypothetical protein SAMN04488548_10914 [Gordonia westfalica]SDT84515.1 hypothetical protein SAMN04488548_10936 [Gordonia westfalica]SDT84557.1 hypothetical protein SAMN04488548_10951 [Gordonia westfalica]